VPAFGLNRWDWSSPRAFAADVARAEALGWDWAFAGVNPLGIWDTYVMLALAAEVTTSIGLGTLLENPVLDSPSSSANSIATVDEISGGRAMLGYGIGDTAVRWQHRAPATVAEMEAATRTARAYLHGEAVDLGGPRPVAMRTARPVPVWIAAGGPRTLRMAGRVADGVFLRVGRHPDNLVHAVSQVRAGAEQAGREPDDVRIGLIFHTVVPDDPALIAPMARSMAAGYYEYSPRLFEIPGIAWDGPPAEELKQGRIGDFHHHPDLVESGSLVGFLDDRAAESFSLHGSADDIAMQINATLDLGFAVDVVVPHPVPLPVPGAAVARAVPASLEGADYTRWFAEAVMPLVSAPA
jgi:5,10-methylenetetrahydromethanopterin reductase